jgi:hypothetical protein
MTVFKDILSSAHGQECMIATLLLFSHTALKHDP